MKRAVWKIAIGATVAIGACAWWLSVASSHTISAPLPDVPESQGHALRATIEGRNPLSSSLSSSLGTPIPQPDHSQTSSASFQQPPEPTILKGFWTLGESGRGELIAGIQGDQHLESATIAFLKQILLNRRCDETTRNNAANALLYQEHIDSDVSTLLLKMFLDSTESVQWRDYVVQHLSVSLPSSPHPEEILDAFRNLTNPPRDGIGATALLHMHRLDGQGYHCFPDILLVSVRQWVTDRSMDQRVRMTCLSIISERRDLLARDQVRALLADADQMVARQALAALGLIGDSSDEAALLSAATSSNEVVAGIARLALDRLRSGNAERTGVAHGDSSSAF